MDAFSSPRSTMPTLPASSSLLDDQESEDGIREMGRGSKHFERLKSLSSEIQNAFTPSLNDCHWRKAENLRRDVVYVEGIMDTLGRLANSDREEASRLMLQLKHAARLSVADFTSHPFNLGRLRQILTRLKLCFPLVDDIERTRGGGTVRNPFITENEASSGSLLNPETLQPERMADLLCAYESLTASQKHCLLCFSILQCRITTPERLAIRKKSLIYWWAAEGFIDLDLEEINEYSPDPSSNGNQETQHISSAQRVKKRKTIEEVGEQIIMVLREKGFIMPQAAEERITTRSCSMDPFVLSFVCKQADGAGFFDFTSDTGKLTPRFTCSHRALLLSPQRFSNSSSVIWPFYTRDHKRLKRLMTARTLFNVNEPTIRIGSEWFSKMKNLSVLHLGNWGPGAEDSIDVAGDEFMENLKNMQQLKLFSLRRVSKIVKLPDSFCKLSNLVILDLKQCCNLEELPAGIGYLKNLTHLDVTDCHLLTELPTGVSSLSKLEVLKGFVIHEQLFNRGNKVAFIFRDLLKLKKLRNLSIVANVREFPSSEELMILKKMVNLRKLEISWERTLGVVRRLSIGRSGEHRGGIWKLKEKASTAWRWCGLSKKANEDSTVETAHDIERSSQGGFLDQIETLKLCFVSGRRAPTWLDPNQLKNLRKLCITGGEIEGLRRGSLENEWKVETVRFKYLNWLEIAWTDLIVMFPHMKYHENFHCRMLGSFPMSLKGMCIIISDKSPSDNISCNATNSQLVDEPGGVMW